MDRNMTGSTKPNFGERIVTGLAASVLVAGLVTGCIKDKGIDAYHPQFSSKTPEFRVPRQERWVRIRYLRGKVIPLPASS
jgi:hypothetical protein